MGKKRAAQRRKLQPPESPAHASSVSVSDFLHEETHGTSTVEAQAHVEVSSKKPARFQRVWSEENELVLLNSMLHYESEKVTGHLFDSRKDRNCFIAESLGGDFTTAQIADKIRRLKRKFIHISAKQVSFFSNSHEKKLFKLSAKIWGRSNTPAADPDIRGPSGAPPPEPDILGPSRAPVGGFNFDVEKLDVGAVSDLLDRAIEATVNVGMDKRLTGLKKEIQVAELELFLKKRELLKRQLTCVLDSSNKLNFLVNLDGITMTVS